MKYILKKEYPGSPKLGNTIDNLENDWIENYPEFWEEVVEKDYEILSLVASERNPQHKKGSKFLHNKDYGFKNMYPTEFWDIYSVKRISDNKIFTIGDFYEDLIIEKMVMSVDNNILTTYKPKIKKPIFKTEDGVDIYESDDNTNGNGKRLYQVALCNSEDFWNDEIKPYDLVILNNHSMRGNKEDFLTFSTKEKAKEYILLNKPCLSLKEIKETTTIKGLSLKKLEKLVKQKYNSPCKL